MASEAQRIAIARAFLKDAPVLVIDEPTADLGPITEREVLDAIHHGLARERSMLVHHSPLRVSSCYPVNPKHRAYS